MSNKKENDIFHEVVAFFIKLIKKIFFGVSKLKNMKILVAFLLTFASSIFALRNKSIFFELEQVLNLELPLIIRYFLYWICLFLPVFFLLIVGLIYDAKAHKYQKIFEDMEYKARNKKYPLLFWEKKDGIKKILCFKSDITLSDWRKNREQLENAFDCNIRIIREGQSKKNVELVTVPSDYKIPYSLAWKDEYISPKDGVIVIGESDIETISFDLNKTPHVLSAGETGSGKSVTIRAILWQMILKKSVTYMIDFKGGVEFGKKYEKYGEVITERIRALEVLQELVIENDKRLHLFRELEVKNLSEYNAKTKSNMPRIGVFLDELAEMLDKKGVPKKDVEIYQKLEGCLSTLARLSRATGINLIMGMQRPDANVLTGQIKNNVPVRICGRYPDKTASEIVLGSSDAFNLPVDNEGKPIPGRMMFKAGSVVKEFQAYYFDDEHLQDNFTEQKKEIKQATKEKEKLETILQVTIKNENIELDLNFD